MSRNKTREEGDQEMGEQVMNNTWSTMEGVTTLAVNDNNAKGGGGGGGGGVERAMERNVVKMKKEWSRVERELGHARRREEKLTESVKEMGKKIDVMSTELESTDTIIRGLSSSFNVQTHSGGPHVS
ncbi:hypothetical protein QJS04_geneDACA013196 [Acorus gramineus]|uniref:Uncharacterized protein n=1 Tax=Acorus gramineus TaxID=55184 RepID=A0AAV9BBM4_ACOGR|nr:hypothetical protein QJS04_geneDACA013196 [Acorus gramineus]